MAHINVNFISSTLQRPVDFDIIIPSITVPELGKYQNNEFRYEGQSKFPVLYLLHGSYNDHHSWFAYTSIERYAEERGIAIVLISGENDYFLNTRKSRYEDFLENELQDYIKGTFPISNRWEDTYIAGLSMGGFGALYHALKYPDKYMGVGAFSPDIIQETKGNKKAINLTKMLDEDIKEGIDVPWLYIAVGNKDSLLRENKVFFLKMKSLKVEGYQKIVPGYDHEWAFWDMEIKYFLDMIPRTDAYANTMEKI